MPLSYVNYTGNGSNKRFEIPFPYISRDHISVLQAGVSVPFTWFSDTFIDTVGTPGAGVNVRPQRITPSDEPLVGYVDGAILTDPNLNTSALQVLYVSQEQQDRVDQLEAELDSVVISGAGVPVADNPSDDGKVLVANGGTWGWVALTLARITDLAAWTVNFLTAASESAALAILGGVPTSRTITTSTGLQGGGNLGGNRTFSLTTTGVAAGTYGRPGFTVDATGRITSATDVSAAAEIASLGLKSAAFVDTGTVAGRVPVLGTQGSLRSGQLLINNNAVGSIPMGGAFVGILIVNTSGANNRGGVAAVRDGSASAIASATNFAVIANTNLSGSSGTAGNVTVSCFGNDILIENRSGFQGTFTYLLVV